MSQRPSFDVLSERWNHAVMSNGTIQAFGLRETLARASADEIVCLANENAPRWLGITGVLAAIVQRADPPKDDRDWIRKVREGWNQKAVDAYLDKWAHAFDVFAEENPWMQGQRLDANAVVGPAAKLTMVHTANTEKRLMEHSRNDAPTPISAADLVLAILSTQALSKGGGNSCDIDNERIELRQGYCYNAANFSLRGRSLRESIALCLLAPEVAALARSPRAIGEDRPAWETKPFEPTKDLTIRDPRGCMDAWTWPTRRIRTDPEVLDDGSIVVRTCRIRQGDELIGLGQKDPRKPWGPSQPWALYRTTKKGALIPVKCMPTQWKRKAPPTWLNVLEAAVATEGRPPLTIQQARRALALDPNCLGQNVVVRVTGVDFETPSGPILMLVNDEAEIPARTLLGGGDASKLVKRVWGVHAGLMDRMRDILIEVRRNGKKPTGQAAKKVRETNDQIIQNSCVMDQFWSEMRELILGRVTDGDDKAWNAGIRRLVDGIENSFANSLGHAPKTIIGLARAGHGSRNRKETTNVVG